jgi:hypothetical protein
VARRSRDGGECVGGVGRCGNGAAVGRFAGGRRRLLSEGTFLPGPIFGRVGGGGGSVVWVGGTVQWSWLGESSWRTEGVASWRERSGLLFVSRVWGDAVRAGPKLRS